MTSIQDYVMEIHELVEIPRNELRKRVYVEQRLEYSDLLEKFEKIYLEECLKIEGMLHDEDCKMKRERGSKKV